MKVTGKRWLYAVIGVIMLLFLGLVYAWSIFAKPIGSDLGLKSNETAMVFTICMSFFCIGGFVAGLITKKKSPRLVLFLSALFVLVGFEVAARANSQLGLILSYGVLIGFGIGMSYNALLGAVTKWFPERTGFISGLLLMGFGFGSFLLGTVSSSMITAMGWRQTFVILGIAVAILVVVGALFIKLPTPDIIFPQSKAPAKQKADSPEGKDFSTPEMLKRPSFWMFFIWAIVLSAAGLALIGNASPCAQDILGVSASTAAMLAGLISIFNGGGRVIMGACFDKFGRKLTMMIVSVGFIVSGVLLLLALNTKILPLLVVAFVLTGFSYGGIMPCNSTFISNFYGRKNYALNFSMINMNLLFASALGSTLTGNILASTGSYFSAFLLIPIYGVLAVVLNLLIKRP